MSLTLEQARKEGRLADFVRQQERWEAGNGHSGADPDQLDKGLEALATEPPPEDRT